jgi:FtsP/CotA-like multicopper oxidase with cupredoxin domain
MKSMQKSAVLRNNFTRANLLRLLVLLVLILGFSAQVFAQLAGQVPLAPNSVPQFVDPLPHFAGQRLNARAGGSMTITMKPTQQIAVSTGTVLADGIVTPGGTIGKANLWAYELQYGTTTKPAHWPAFTIEAQRQNRLNVTYVNALDGEKYESVGLIVDETLHWANSPEFDGSNPPAVVHLHGGEVASQYDGGPDSWFTPGYLKTGPAWNAGVTQYYEYGNTQEATTLWFHDHALGVTRLNVYAGMAGFYFLKDEAEDALHLPGWSGDNLVQQLDRLTGSAVGDPYLPEIEIAIQDRMFDTNGQLYFPNLPPNPDVHPYWTPEFVGILLR